MTERFNPQERLRKGIDEFLQSSGAGLEEVVNAKAFGDILAQITGNLVSLNRISGEAMDMLIRNARLAGRRDVSELGRQLARNEDKLEAVLAVVEDLQDQLKDARAEADSLRASSGSDNGTKKTAARKTAASEG